ncbi:MAG: DUF59 domain-containing protein [Bacteroidales bacterium]|nr:DUF59 domain-containing protein [Bacteroidales bacterium]
MLHQLTSSEQNIVEIIKTVIDPEVAINIVDLGLIYEVHHQENEKTIHVVMTLSARGCPVGDTIIQNVDTVIQAEYLDHTISVELSWEPQWTPDMITEDGKAALNM